jgi:hypothetical protein
MMTAEIVLSIIFPSLAVHVRFLKESLPALTTSADALIFSPSSWVKGKYPSATAAALQMHSIWRSNEVGRADRGQRYRSANVASIGTNILLDPGHAEQESQE